jgi:hypothetical protein
MAEVLTSGRRMRGPGGGRWNVSGGVQPVGLRTPTRLLLNGGSGSVPERVWPMGGTGRQALDPGPSGNWGRAIDGAPRSFWLRSKGVHSEHICKRKQSGPSANEATQRRMSRGPNPCEGVRKRVVRRPPRVPSRTAGPLGCRPCTQGRPLQAESLAEDDGVRRALGRDSRGSRLAAAVATDRRNHQLPEAGCVLRPDEHGGTAAGLDVAPPTSDIVAS